MMLQVRMGIVNVEQSLENMNRAQGLGLIVMRRNIDLKTLLKIFAYLLSIATTVVPIVNNYAAGNDPQPAASGGSLEFSGTGNPFTISAAMRAHIKTDKCGETGDLCSVPLASQGFAMAFRGSILSADLHRRNAAIFDFGDGGSVSRENDPDNFRLEFNDTTGKMCYSTGRALQYSCFLNTFCSRPADDGILCTENCVSKLSRICTTEIFPTNEFIEVGLIHSNGIGTIYWNGLVKAEGNMPPLRESSRANHYIGLSNLNTNELFAGSMSDLRWYNSAEITKIGDISTTPGPDVADPDSKAKAVSPAIAVASREVCV